MFRSLVFASLLGLFACRAPAGTSEADVSDPVRIEVEALLDDWHDAASEADAERYFGHMSPDAVFLGTDATERWSVDEFREYAEPYFGQGQGWTYLPKERHVFLAGSVAWFDERLWNEKYGECRGTGVLRRSQGEWKLSHYNLAFPIPNRLASDVIALIRGN